jgi:hypothetical protein
VRAAVGSIALVVVALCSPARADDKPWAIGVSDAEQKAALAIYKAGNVEFEESRYAQALAKYRDALAHWNHPAIRFNMAVALVNLDQPLEAYEHLEAAMKFGAAPLGNELYAQGVTYKKLLDGRLTHLRVMCDIDGADVTLDGKPLMNGRGDVRRLLMPGAHQVVASKSGYVTETAALSLTSGEEHVHAVKLVVIALRTKTVRRWGAAKPWLVVGSGAVAVAVGGVLELLAKKDFATYDAYLPKDCPNGCGPNVPGMPIVPARHAAVQTQARIENVAGVSMLVAGGAAVVAGLVAVYLNLPRTVADHAPAITPMIGSNGAGAAASWSF